MPSLVNGLTPVQRKVIYASFGRHLHEEIKVPALAGSVIDKAAYHHSEKPLMRTIIGLAQDFVGSNNLPLLV